MVIVLFLILWLCMPFDAAAQSRPAYYPDDGTDAVFPVYPRRSPYGGGIGGAAMGNGRLRMQKMSAKPRYAPDYVPSRPSVSKRTPAAHSPESVNARTEETSGSEMEQRGKKLFEPEAAKKLMNVRNEPTEFDKLPEERKKKLLKNVIFEKN